MLSRRARRSFGSTTSLQPNNPTASPGDFRRSSRLMAIAASQAGRILPAAGPDEERRHDGRHVPNPAETVASSGLNQDIPGRQALLRAIHEMDGKWAGGGHAQ